MIQEIRIYKCSECNKTYLLNPIKCICENVNKPGKIIGAFTLETQIGDKWKVKCNLCTNRKIIHLSNLHRQKSCGCVPKSINIITVTPYSVRYKCNKCGITSVSDFPILEWCCEENNN